MSDLARAATRYQPVATLLAIVFALVASASSAQAQPATVSTPDVQIMRIKPSQADPAVRAFDESNVVLVPRDAAADAPLAVFLPGTGGRPENALLLLGVIAQQGYRVIGLEYNDEPAVVQVCPRRPDADCSAEFRRERVFGGSPNPPVSNPVAESIVRRLVMLLRHLHSLQPDAQWDRYLDGEEPAWSRIVFSGLSQGAGMAAFIAKKKPVARVVLFSSPWDFYGPRRTLAPWLSEPSATAADRWFAAVHRRENTASQIAQAYRLLAIPDSQIRVFDLEPQEGAGGANPFHSSTIRVPAYTAEWQWLYGRATGVK